MVAYHGIGTELQIEIGNDYETIPGCSSITGPGQMREMVDVTSLDSTGGYKEYIPGTRDSEEVSCEVFWQFDDDVQNEVQASFDTQDLRNFQIVFNTPLNDTFQFSGYVTNLGMAVPVDGAITRSLTIKITGPVTQTNDAP